MPMVPLVRPSLPPYEAWAPYFAKSETAGVFSNFGPCWHLAAERLSEMTGRIAIPCSNGTDALVLALIAAQRPYVAYTAFTFQAARVAALRYAGAAEAVRTGATIDDIDAADTTIIRTIPFGSFQEFKPEPLAQLVIDAAGAFGPTAFDQYPADAIITCSFHATKNFPIGEGGAVFLPKGWDYQAGLVRAAMNFSLTSQRKDWCLPASGNYKLSEIACAMLLAQLDRSDYFEQRSERIGATSYELAKSVDCWLPYATGSAQSLVVVAHRKPQHLVESLAAAGFVARRVYHPFINEDLLTYDQARMVALPSDCVPNEFACMQEVLGA